jgi:hypothetical protein
MTIKFYRFFHLQSYFAQRIGIGAIQIYHKSERGGRMYTLPINTTNPKKGQFACV